MIWNYTITYVFDKLVVPSNTVVIHSMSIDLLLRIDWGRFYHPIVCYLWLQRPSSNRCLWSCHRAKLKYKIIYKPWAIIRKIGHEKCRVLKINEVSMALTAYFSSWMTFLYQFIMFVSRPTQICNFTEAQYLYNINLSSMSTM